MTKECCGNYTDFDYSDFIGSLVSVKSLPIYNTLPHFTENNGELKIKDILFRVSETGKTICIVNLVGMECDFTLKDLVYTGQGEENEGESEEDEDEKTIPPCCSCCCLAGVWYYENMIGARVIIRSMPIYNRLVAFSSDSEYKIKNIFFRVYENGKIVCIVKLDGIDGDFMFRDLEITRINGPKNE